MPRHHSIFRFLIRLAACIPVAAVCLVEAAESKSSVRTTAYTHTEADHLEHGKKTASGTTLQNTKSYTSAAADWSKYPLGTKFKIDGMDTVFVVDDYGRALVGTETIDLYKPSKSAMNDWGVRNVDIKIIEEGDFEKSREILADRTKFAHCRKMLASIDSIEKDREKSTGGWRSLFKRSEKSMPTPAPAPAKPSLPPPPPASQSEPTMQLAAASLTPSRPPSAPIAPPPIPVAPKPTPAKVEPQPVNPRPAVLAAAPPPAPVAPASAPVVPIAAAPPAVATAPAPIPTPVPVIPEPAIRKVRPLSVDPTSDQMVASTGPAVDHSQSDEVANNLRKRAFRPL